MRIIKKNIIKTLVCVSFLFFVFSIISVKSVFAEFINTNVTVNFDTSKITISGNSAQYEIITITIFSQSDSDFEIPNIIFTDQLRANEYGDFSCSLFMALSEISGNYTVLFKTNTGDTITQNFKYMSKPDVDAILHQINSCINITEMEQIIQSNPDLFRVPYSYDSILNKQPVYNSLIGKSFSSLQAINSELTYALLLEKINEASSANQLQELITSNTALLTFPPSYNNIQDKTAVYNYLFDKSFNNWQSFYIELDNSILLAQINEASNPQQLEQLILANNTLLQVDFSQYYNKINASYRREVWSRLLLQNYQSLIEFKYFFNNVCTEVYKTSMHPISSGGGGDGGDGGNTVTIFPVSIQNISLIEDDYSSQLSFQAKSNLSEITNINIYVALYNSNGELTKLKRIAHEIAPDNSCFVDMEYLKQNPDDTSNYKILVWDDNMCPLSIIKTNIVQ